MTPDNLRPWGANPAPGGGTRFRLWAPAAKPTLMLGAAGEREIAMQPVGEGWHEAVVADAAPGQLYRYRLPDGLLVPDPASRFQPQDVHGPSQIVDPAAFQWTDGEWAGRPWHEAVKYELHPGTFTPSGSWDGVREKLTHLSDLGVTVLELMPPADAPGQRGWGYDGVLPFAPNAAYGRPEDLVRLIDTAHSLGLMVFVDVVYNHFGPDGNYLHAYAPEYFTGRHSTPWGPAIDYSRAPARDFMIQNMLHWILDYHIDGLRLDAVFTIHERGQPDILFHAAERVHETVAMLAPGRRVHLVVEDDENIARQLARREDGSPKYYSAQWTDDFHHAAHVLATGEAEGYYADYAEDPTTHLLRCLSEGFAWQGESSPFRGGRARGEPSRHLPPTAFVTYLQNHDQTGNRAFGERLSVLAEPHRLRCLTALWLLAPNVPMLWMGQEWGAREPFLFFCDFDDELGRAVREGRRREFKGFAAFADEAKRETIPDPNDPATFEASKLDWSVLDAPEHANWLRLHRDLLAIRHREIIPLIPQIMAGAARGDRFGATGLRVDWRLQTGGHLTLIANVGEDEQAFGLPQDRELYATHPAGQKIPGWSCRWSVEP